MDFKTKDPFCNYLLQGSSGKDLLLSKLDSDIEFIYGKETRYKAEDFHTGKALLYITKDVFNNKKLLKDFSGNEEILEFHQKNCELLEKLIRSEVFSGEQYFPILTNFMNAADRFLSDTKKGAKNSSEYLNAEKTVQFVRESNGFKCRSAEEIRIHYLIKKTLLLLGQIILACLIIILGLIAGEWAGIISPDPNNLFLNPILENVRTILRQLIPLRAANILSIDKAVILIIIVLLLVLAGTFVLRAKLKKNKQREFGIHYFSRIIGISAEKLRDAGGL